MEVSRRVMKCLERMRVMFFTSQRRGSAGLGAIVGVGLVVAGYIAAAIVMFDSYTHGADDGSSRSGCELVCGPKAASHANG
jgi:hypothetical protein